MMRTSWRLAHLALAVVTSVFLLIASATGVVLAIHAVNERTVSSFETVSARDLTLSGALPAIRQAHPGLQSIVVNKYEQVVVLAEDADFNQQRLIINPHTGAVITTEDADSKFIQWTLSLHRSLFLHETGRFIVGIISFLFLLMLVSGVALLLKRQKKLRKVFRRPRGGSGSSRLHVVLGQLFIIPLLLTAASGTYLFMQRFELLPKQAAHTLSYADASGSSRVSPEQFPVFKNLRFSELRQLDFPFFDDPDEYYIVKLSDREWKINQYSGAIIEETRYPFHALAGQFSLELHTGTTNTAWALVLALSSLSIFGFSISGFIIAYKRLFNKRNNKYKAREAEIVLLTGTENGSTHRFARAVYEQLLDAGCKVYIDEMNTYRNYPGLRQLIIFTSTYGEGEAPSSATRFGKLVGKHPQSGKVSYSVVGFGSTAYEHYCAYAREVDQLLRRQSWATPLTEVHTVNKRSVTDFANWAAVWSQHTTLPLSGDPGYYKKKCRK